jgi:hypothetical protein
MESEDISPWLARLSKAVTRPPVPEQRPVYDFDMPTDPLDRYAREQEVWNNSTVSPEQVSANKSQNLHDLMSVIPGPGNVIAAKDAYSGAGDAATSFGEGRYGKGAVQTLLAALSGVGAVTGLPTGRMAGKAAHGASSRTNIFAGPMAKTADHAALAQAKEMAAANAGRDAIHARTGWFQGADGNWRFEISDNQANLGSIYDPIGAVYANGKPPGLADVVGFKSLDHPELNAAYDSPGTMTGHYGSKIEYAGEYNPITQNIKIKAQDADRAKSIALHERQHQIQDTERWASGGDPDMEAQHLFRRPAATQDEHRNAVANYKRLAGEVEARNTQSRRNMTPEERRITPPWQTQEFPDQEQIIRYDLLKQRAFPAFDDKLIKVLSKE